jgi:hypothetical protein
MLTATTLPNPSLITEPAKTADMISISSRGICGEDDFRCRREKESIISGVTKAILQVKSAGIG